MNKDKTDKTIKSNLPLDLQHPGGFVEATMDYINATAVCRQPMFALGSALALGGVLYGRHVQSKDGLSTNLFVECVGYTSSGKDHGLKSIARILDNCGAGHLRLGQVTSSSAIEWALKRNPRQIALIDEAGYFFTGVNDTRSGNSNANSIKPALLELWSSSGDTWKGKQRVPKDGKTEQEPITIVRPHLSLYGTSQPQILFENISKNDLRDGWLPRNLWFISELRPMPESKERLPIPNVIHAEVLAYKDEPPAPITVPSDAAAEAIFQDFTKKVYDKMSAADANGDETNYLYGKAVENARRVALILAVSRTFGRPLEAVIRAEDAQYTTLLVDYLIHGVIACVQATLAENVDEKNKKRLLQLIKKAKFMGLTRNELTRKTQNLRRGLRDEYIQDLLEGDLITIKSFKEGRMHGERYVAKEFTRPE